MTKRFGLNYPYKFAIDHQHIVGRARTQEEFADGEAQSGTQIVLLAILHDPASCDQHIVDLLASTLLRLHPFVSLSIMRGKCAINLNVCYLVYSLAQDKSS